MGLKFRFVWQYGSRLIVMENKILRFDLVSPTYFMGMAKMIDVITDNYGDLK